MIGLTETVRVMARGSGGLDEMGEPAKTWTPIDVPECLVRVKYKDAESDEVDGTRPDAARITVYVAMSSSAISHQLLDRAKLRFPDRFSGDELEANELVVTGITWPTPQSPLVWDMLVEAVAQHG